MEEDQPETFREYINLKLRRIPRDYVDPMRVRLDPAMRVKTYYNDCYLRFECTMCAGHWSSIVGHCYIKFKVRKNKKEKVGKVGKGKKNE